MALDLDLPSDEPGDGRGESAYIVYGDIPWPHPKEGHILGYGRPYFHHSIPDAKDYGQIEGLCWQQCRACGTFGIAPLGAPFCEECVVSIWRAVTSEIEAARLDQPAREAYMLDQSPRATSRAIVNIDFFCFNHKSHLLQQAYAEARAARF